MAIHSLTIDRFSTRTSRSTARGGTSHRSGTLRERLCIVILVTED